MNFLRVTWLNYLLECYLLQDKFGKKVVALSLYTLDDCVQIRWDSNHHNLA